MISYETIRIKIRREYIKKTSIFRRSKINNTNFTIISNNCWGGFVYQSYGLEYNTPTIGLFFMAEDYIKFAKNTKYYIECKLKFVDPKESKWAEDLNGTHKFGEYPIGILDDIEIHFLHYKSEKEVLDNWKRRLGRINWNKVLYKFNDQNLCTNEDIKKFSELPYKNKICFTSKEYKLPYTKYIKIPKKYFEIQTSYEPVGKSSVININDIINNL